MLLGSAAMLSSEGRTTAGSVLPSRAFLATGSTLEYSIRIHGATVAIYMALLAKLSGRRALPIREATLVMWIPWWIREAVRVIEHGRAMRDVTYYAVLIIAAAVVQGV